MSSSNKCCVVSTLLDCKVESSPIVLTKFGNNRILRVNVSCKRKSGVSDYFYVNYPSSLNIVLNEGDYISVNGDIRTLNKGNTDFVVEGFIYAKSIEVLSEEPESYRNETIIENAELYKFIEVRSSYSDDSVVIADYKLKLARSHGRNSYFKTTSWGSDATFLGNIHKDVKYMNIKCRLQSYYSKKSGNLYLCLAVYHLDIEKPEKGDTD